MADYEVEMLVRVSLDAKEVEAGDTPIDTAEKLVKSVGGVEIVEIYGCEDLSDVYGSAPE